MWIRLKATYTTWNNPNDIRAIEKVVKSFQELFDYIDEECGEDEILKITIQHLGCET